MLPVRPEAVSAPDAGVGPPPVAPGARGDQAGVDWPEPAHTWPARLSGGALKSGVKYELFINILHCLTRRAGLGLSLSKLKSLKSSPIEFMKASSSS